uniref:ULP_PROTEASE domain-containing protein n=1 Tax=Haemonchus contortus TaxID=6289 RepID=A0A7I5E8R0_HAECO|nr:unnamed protein product [Haemonchus contortus]
MRLPDSLQDGFDLLLKSLGSDEPHSGESVREKVASVLKDQFLSRVRRPSCGIVSSNVHREETEKIRQFLLGKLPFRELHRLITSILNRKPSESVGTSAGAECLRLPYKRHNNANFGRGNKGQHFVKRPSKARSRIFQSDCHPFESIQLGRFLVSWSRQDWRVSCPKTNYVRICRRSNSLIYCISSERDGHRYVSTYMVPIPFINGIYVNGRDVFLRLVSCAMFESCLCDGKDVNFDVTDGERSNALLHHIVFQSDSHAFCERLLNLNRAYYSKLFKSFSDFFEGIPGVSSPDELRAKARRIVSRNARILPSSNKSKLSSHPLLSEKQRTTTKTEGTDVTKPARTTERSSNINFVNELDHYIGIMNEQTLPSGYSLQQIPDNESTIETPGPVVGLPEFYNAAVANRPFTNVDGRLDTECAFMDEGTSNLMAISSPIQEFPRLHGIPMATTEGSQENFKSCSSGSGGVPSLYVQQEYRSKDEGFDGSLPVRTDHFDVTLWPPSPYHFNDNTLEFLDPYGDPLPVLPSCDESYGQSMFSRADVGLEFN